MSWTTTSTAAVACLALLGCGDDAATKIDAGGDGGGGAAMDELVRACGPVNACAGFDMNACVFLLGTRGDRSVLDCLLASSAADCTAVRACIGQRQTTDASCVEGCLDGDTIVRCFEGNTRVEYDCPAYLENVGPVCVTSGGREGCGGMECTVDGEWTCSGTTSHHCDMPITEAYDCANVGLECVPRAPGCVGVASGSCGAEPASCDGDTLLTCDEGTLRRTDCRRQGGRTCVTDATGARCAYGTACAAGTTDDTCNGNVLQACVVGAAITLDCTTIGASGCAAAAGQDARCIR